MISPDLAASLVLVVDDEEAVRRSSARLLARAGFEVLEAGSGADALALLAEQDRPVDVVISDVVMPGMTGLELVAAIRERWPATEVLLFSGFTPSALARHELAGGRDLTILQKPVERAELVAVVTAAATRARAG